MSTIRAFLSDLGVASLNLANMNSGAHPEVIEIMLAGTRAAPETATSNRSASCARAGLVK